MCATIILTVSVSGQEFNKTINKDSLLQVIVKKLPENKKAELLNLYNEGNDQSKEFLLYMLSLPVSSKKDMIANIDTNIQKINILNNKFLKLVPKDYIVSIEFNPANNILSTNESIDLRIQALNNKENAINQEWNLENNSVKLTEMIKSIGWTTETLVIIKKLLNEAKCVSIENGEITTIGFARSGMGKYYFKLFPNDLNSEQQKQYNGGCTYIYYKNNIVLEYGGGAVGNNCFPDL